MKQPGSHRFSYLYTICKVRPKPIGISYQILILIATALDAAGIDDITDLSLDGVSLVPYLYESRTYSRPHEELYWRKDKMAAARFGDHKIIRVENIPSVMYDLSKDLGELNDLSASEVNQFQLMHTNLDAWETGLISPDWTEGTKWNDVTWMIHQDLMSNNEVRVKNPGQLKKLRQTVASK